MNTMNADFAPTLLTEAHHRIANSLAAIAGVVRIQANDTASVQRLRSPAELKDFLNEIGTRIETAAQLHRMLSAPDYSDVVDLVVYLPAIADSVRMSNPGGETEIICDLGASCRLPAEQGLAIGLVVAELVTNAIKYAHPTGVSGRVALSCAQSGGVVTLSVADDGIGLPVGFDPDEANGTGMRLVRALTKQLEAEIEFEDRGVGLCVTLSIPTD